MDGKQVRFLILGLDEGFKRSRPGYADTIILVATSGLKHNPVMISIPRDLWIPTSGREGNRIGVVYTIAESKGTGKGPSAVTAIVSEGFQIPIDHYVLVRMEGFISIVDALGGVDIILPRPMAGYPSGVTHLDGRAALAFARDRYETDDFTRMVQAQILIRGFIAQAFKVGSWSKLFQVLYVLRGAIQSNIPFLQLPGLACMILHSYLNGIEGYTITRDMVNPTITLQGEQVLEPDWDKIIPLTLMIFDR